ncbi:MAG: hypothetical protein RLZZ127_743, partial [Planctomycetota bacterium]
MLLRCSVPVLLTWAALAAAEGPHLLVDADALARIRAAAAIPGSHHGQALAANRDWCDRLGEGIIKGRDRSTGNWAYDRSYLAVKAAAVHAVTGDPAYAGLALRALEAITADPDPEKRTMEDGTGLSRATVTVGYALAWDLAAPAWPADRRARILATMQAAAVTWDGAGHPNIAGDYHSNWTSVMRGGEILLRLALGETESPRMALITGELLKHVRSHGSAGWSQEGPIYLGYSMAFGAPAAVALERAGKPAVAEAMRAKAFWRLPMHTGTFSAGQFAPSWGVGGPYFDERGWLGLQAQLVPAADLPGYLWFYDRYRGVANPAPAKDKFDHRGWGQALALLGYPAGVQPADPTATAAGVLTDDHGGAFWRPRWRDAGDPVVGLVADAHAAARAWDNLDAGNLILIAHGSVFAAAAGNASHDRLGDDVSRMVFGGRSNPDTTLTGRLLYAEGDATGMRAGIDYSAAVRGTGPTSVTRHIGTVAVGDDVAMLVVDAWDMRGSRPVAWTLNQMDGIAAIEPLSDGGRPGFLVRGQQGGWLAGWLVGPAAAELVPRDPLRLTWTATDGGAAVVAMVMGSGPRPVPRSIGDGIGGEVQVAGASLRWDAKAGRVIATRLPGPHADFSISATTGTAPLTVRVAAAQGLDQVRWSVDGKAVAAGAGAEITLADGGAPRIRLDSAQGAAEIQVQVANRPPVPRIAADRTFGPAPLAVRLDASGSSDPDGHPLAFSWQLPGGERVEGPVLARTFDGRDAVVEVALTVSDGHGGRSGTVQRILVGNQAPAVAATVTPRRGPPPLAVRLDAGASRDPEGGALTASWLLPDGTTAQGLEVPATITIPGLHRIRCTVRDTAGATASQEVLVEVADQPPVIRIGPDLPAVDPKVLAKDPAEQSRRRWGV